MNEIMTIIVILVFSAFFSGMEIAFIGSNKLRIELDKKQGVFGSGIISTFVQNPGRYIATMLIGKNISLAASGILISRLLQPLLAQTINSDPANIILQILIAASLFLLISEIISRTLFNITPNFFLRTFSLPAVFFYVLFYPVSKFTLATSNLFINLFFGLKKGVKDQENTVFSKVDPDSLVNRGNKAYEKGEKDQDNIRILQNALDLSNIRLYECMIPRTEIIALDIDSSIDDLKAKFIEHQLSRILIYKDTTDNMVGYFELKDIFKNQPDINSSLKKLAIVPETMSASKLLKKFVDEKKSIALVVDEFGGTSGLVTIEDILEEIVGDIEDEHDISKFTEKKISENEFIFSGRLEIDYLNEKYNLNLPESDDYNTLAGMVFYYHGSIPGKNDIIRVRNLIIKVLRVTSTRLELVNLKIE
jgi:CBS domain containing-hemolysin-like protein